MQWLSAESEGEVKAAAAIEVAPQREITIHGLVVREDMRKRGVGTVVVNVIGVLAERVGAVVTSADALTAAKGGNPKFWESVGYYPPTRSDGYHPSHAALFARDIERLIRPC